MTIQTPKTIPTIPEHQRDSIRQMDSGALMDFQLRLQIECDMSDQAAADYIAQATRAEAELVIVETMPEWLRDSHRAAGNRGVYPVNGAERIDVTRAEADELVAADPEWTTIVD